MNCLKTITVAIFLMIYQNAFAENGLLFNVIVNGAPSNLNITLCLNGKRPLSCQNYDVSAVTLSVLTARPNHTYPFAGIRINTPGYSLAYFGVNCVPNQYGFCQFSVSDRRPALFSIFTPGWDAGTPIDNNGSLTSVSCPTNSFCMAVDSAGNAIPYDGANWGIPTNISNGNQLSSISCTSSLFCVAVGPRGKAYKYNGTSWTEISIRNQTVSFSAISCPDGSFCMAVGSSNSGKMYKYDGNQWSDVTPVSTPNPLYTVSCPTSLFCIAAGELGHTYKYTGTTWSASSILADSGAQLFGVSCPTISFCIAIDGLGTAFKYDGSWDNGVPLDSPNTPTLMSVSCPSSSFCMAVDDGGLAYQFDGQTWSSGVRIASSNFLSAVSCPNSTFCIAMNETTPPNPGIAYSYRN